jgi:kynurenine formamidase
VGVGSFVELSHVITDGMTTYPGLPGPVITDHLSRVDSRRRYAPGVEFQIGRIDMVANTGTYLDTPAHRYPDRPDLAGIALEQCVDLPGVRVAAPAPSGRAAGRAVGAADRAVGAADRAVGAAILDAAVGDRDLAGAAVLVHTGWDRHWGTAAYGDPAPYLTADAVAWLVARRPALVGIDSVNIDAMEDLARPVHSGLLAAGILIVEHLTGLDRLPADGFRFSAVAPRVAGMGTFPVRAFAVVS